MQRDIDSNSITPAEENTLPNSGTDFEDLDSVTGPEHSLLNNQILKLHSEQEDRDYRMTPMGQLRAYWLGIVVCIGGFLCEFVRNENQSRFSSAVAEH